MLLHYLLLAFVSHGVRCISQEYNDQLMYDIEWKGPLLVQENELQESIVLTTKANEKYKCLLPIMEDESMTNADGMKGPSPEVCLADVLTQATAKKCSIRLEPYWTYEICHGEIVKQYHEEKADDGTVSKTEYVLGRLTKLEVKEILTSSINSGKEKQKVSKRRINNRETPYYSVVMSNGTPCDLSNGKFRSTTVLYICHPSSHSEILSIKEVTTCEYELVVLTPNLCKNPLYIVKAKPVHSIQCHALDGAPRSPVKKDKETMSIKNSNIKIVTKPTPTQPPHIRMVTAPPRPIVVDPALSQRFLDGLYCLIGGLGWWQYELCHGRFINQFHQEPKKKNIVIRLGFWNKEKHLEWAKKNMKKAKASNFVTHFYSGGDVCDLTGKPREAQVRLICKEGGGQQIVIYMQEHQTCKYTVVVESAILCPLVENADSYGLFPNQKQRGEL